MQVKGSYVDNSAPTVVSGNDSAEVTVNVGGTGGAPLELAVFGQAHTHLYTVW